jgi:oligo-alginate lyase
MRKSQHNIKPFLICLMISLSTVCQAVEILPTDKLHEHPRLFFLKNEEIQIKKKNATEKILSDVHQLILTESNRIISLPVLTRNQVGRRILHTSREAIRRILYLSYTFRMTAETKYSERAQKEMMNLAAFDNWNPTHFLDVAEMTMAMSIGYDWLYNELSPENKTIIQEAILNKGIQPSTEEKYNKWLKNTNNWNQVCNGGISAGVVALFDTNPKEFSTLMNRAITSLPLAMHEYANNGAYPEGYHYWDYGTSYNVLMLDILTQNWNSDFELKKHPGFMETATFMQNMEGFFLPTRNANVLYPRCFNYSDCGEGTLVNPAMFWFAGQNSNSGIIFNEIKKLKIDLKYNTENLLNNRFLPFLLIWSKNIDFQRTLPPKRKMFVSNGKTEIAMMRTSWVDNNGIYVGVKGGTPSASHQHMDVGSFIMEANGVRWALDFGLQEYHSLESKGIDLWNRAQESQRWDVFRYKNTSHNTLTINNQKQLVAGNATIKSISETENNMAVSVDLTSLYEKEAKKVERKVSLLNQEQVQISDFVTTFDKQIIVRWNMLTQASPVIIDNQTILLTQEGKKLKVKLTGVESAKAYINSTVSPNEFDALNNGTAFIGFDISIPANSSKNYIVSLTSLF